jgi:6-phosphogluconolactonase
MYAILETIRELGTVTRYSVDTGGELAEQESWTASGRSTCYLALAPDGAAAIVINYWDAVIDVVEVDQAGALGSITQSFVQVCRPDGEWRQVTDREDHWGNRQVGPHAHCAHFWNNWVFIPDLGENAVFQYRWDPAARQLQQEMWIEFEAGSGPRHMALHPDLDICYVSNELFNTVCVARLDPTDPETVKPRLIPIQYESTVDDRDEVSYVSEIKLSADARFLYVSNRGDDSIAVFRVGDDGTIERIGLTPTGGRFPRHFAIAPDGRSVVVANQDSGQIRLLDRDPATGLLEPTDVVHEVAAPNYIRFLDQ